MEHECKYDKAMGTIEANLKNIKDDIHIIKTNDLAHIYKKLDRLPTWAVSIIAFFSCIIGIMATLLAKGV